MANTHGIHTVIGRARRRLKLQSALEVGTLSTIAGLALALVSVFIVRSRWVSETTGVVLLASAGGGVLLGTLFGALRRFSDADVAKRLDRASGLSDRLGTACAFEVILADPERRAALDDETRAMMDAAIRDGVQAASDSERVRVKAATPFHVPPDSRAAAAFAIVVALTAGLWWPHVEKIKLRLSGTVTLAGQPLPNTGAPRGRLVFVETSHRRGHEFNATDSADKNDGDDDAQRGRLQMPLGADGPFSFDRTLMSGTYQIVYEPNAARCAAAAAADSTTTAESPTALTVKLKMPCRSGVVVEILNLETGRKSSDPRHHLLCDDERCTLDIDIPAHFDKPNNPFDIDTDDIDYISDLVNDLRHTAQAEKDPSLQDFVEKIDDLLARAERGELTKEQLLEELKRAENEFNASSDPNIDESLADLKETGKELKRNKLTRELGKALEKGDLERAKQEMEQLAKKLESGKMSEKQKKDLAKALEKTADKFEKKDKKRDEKLDKKIAEQERQLKKLKRQMDKAKKDKDEKKEQRLSRRMKDKQRKLKKLQRKKQQRQQSSSKRQLKQLHRNMKSAAQNMRNKNQKQQKQASRRMRDMKRNTGKVDSDKRKVRTQKKVASQLTDLKEAMRRAKRRANRGPRDMFGKNRKNRDFGRRARGKRGSRQAWKPGKGRRGMGNKGGKPGQGRNGPGTKGNGRGGNDYGDGHDPNLLDAPTAKGGHTKDESVSGIHGRGPSMRETILTAAQKGFASRSYKKVYTAYKSIVEEVMQTEKVPSGYKYYIKRYFQKIKPHASE